MEHLEPTAVKTAPGVFFLTMKMNVGYRAALNTLCVGILVLFFLNILWLFVYFLFCDLLFVCGLQVVLSFFLHSIDVACVPSVDFLCLVPPFVVPACTGHVLHPNVLHLSNHLPLCVFMILGSLLSDCHTLWFRFTNHWMNFPQLDWLPG